MTEQTSSCSVNSPSDCDKKFSDKKESMLIGWGCLNLFKSFSVWCFLLFFMVCDRNCLFFILYEKLWIFLCTTCLIRNSNTPMSLAINMMDLLRWFLIITWIFPIISKVLFWSKQSAFKLPYLCNHHWTHPTPLEFAVLSWYLTLQHSEIFT